ncbi:hypothetical protein GIB67_022310 [Kingdonia uniflora]|uniref:Uncharacterized protein n=1 Tax=Kingdonia uniflora TaxID=39325 RepID=A0A7J7KW35_9MAGN|nr:hypothetical protein GIB67_022310 [Kingdonia uniflora]
MKNIAFKYMVLGGKSETNYLGALVATVCNIRKSRVISPLVGFEVGMSSSVLCRLARRCTGVETTIRSSCFCLPGIQTALLPVIPPVCRSRNCAAGVVPVAVGAEFPPQTSTACLKLPFLITVVCRNLPVCCCCIPLLKSDLRERYNFVVVNKRGSSSGGGGSSSGGSGGSSGGSGSRGSSSSGKTFGGSDPKNGRKRNGNVYVAAMATGTSGDSAGSGNMYNVSPYAIVSEEKPIFLAIEVICFKRENNTRIFQLSNEIENFKQASVPSENVSIPPTAAEIYVKIMEKTWVFQFLAGLNPDFEYARVHLLNKTPFPTLEEAHAYCLSDQSRRSPMPPISGIPLKISVMAVRYAYSAPPSVPSHTSSPSLSLRPAGYQPRPSQSSAHLFADSSALDFSAFSTHFHDEINTFRQLLSMSSTPVASHAGNFTSINRASASPTSPWIVDSGVIDNMTSMSSLFRSYASSSWRQTVRLAN